MELYIFNSALESKGILENWYSVIWTRKYSRAGEFEIHLNFTDGITELITESDIIWKSDSDEAGFVNHVELSVNVEGHEIYIIRGMLMLGYADRRIIWSNYNNYDSAENIIRDLVNNSMIEPTDPSRIIDNVILGEPNDIGVKDRYQANYKNILKAIEDLATENELGVELQFEVEQRKLVLNIYEGLDRTTSQQINPPAIFAQEFENILEQEYESGIHDFRNSSIIAGEGEGSDRQVEAIEVGEGLDRYELYVDARDLQTTKTVGENQVDIPVSEYKELLLNRGKQKLSENNRVESFNSSINLNSNLTYKVDFNLGDKVTVLSTRWGLMIEERITEITEIHEESGMILNVVFGEESKGIVQKISREVNR